MSIRWGFGMTNLEVTLLACAKNLGSVFYVSRWTQTFFLKRRWGKIFKGSHVQILFLIHKNDWNSMSEFRISGSSTLWWL